MTGEVVSVHIGQAGCQIGHALWELFCLEHQISADGSVAFNCEPHSRRVVFSDGGDAERCVPRAIMCDTEPTVVDEVRSGAYRSLFHPKNLISYKESAAGNYAVGHNVVGPKLLPQVREQLRHLIEACDRLEGCMLFHSLGGGTGSGFTTLLLESMAKDYGMKVNHLQMAVYPSPRLATGPVEPYNTAACLSKQLNSASGVLVLDNEAMYSIIRQHFGRAAHSSDFTLANRLASQVISSITCTMRFGGNLSARMNEISTNLIAYREQRFLIPSYAPLHSVGRLPTESDSGPGLLEQALSNHNAFAKVGLAGKPQQAACFLFRGSITPSEGDRWVQESKSKGWMTVQPWLSTGVKVGYCSVPPTAVPGSGIGSCSKAVAVISNTPAIVRKFHNLAAKFDQMFRTGSYLQTFVANGFTKDCFQAARHALKYLETSYLQGVDNPDVYYEMESENGGQGMGVGEHSAHRDRMRFRLW